MVDKGLDGLTRQAIAEAATIGSALEAMRTGRHFGVAQVESATVPTATNPEEEVSWLCLVALAHERSSVVEAVVSELRKDPSTAGS
jgi:hypothetical protein